MSHNLYKFLLTVTVLFIGSSGGAWADTTSPKEEVRAVLDQIFDAMRAGDGTTLRSLILPDTPLDRISPDKPIHHGKDSDWISWVDSLKPGQADEQIFDVKINIEGPLATAWTPFTIKIDGVLKSCGVNHFTLVKGDAGWKVAYLIDTHTPEKCGIKEG